MYGIWKERTPNYDFFWNMYFIRSNISKMSQTAKILELRRRMKEIKNIRNTTRLLRQPKIQQIQEKEISDLIDKQNLEVEQAELEQAVDLYFHLEEEEANYYEAEIEIYNTVKDMNQTEYNEFMDPDK